LLSYNLLRKSKISNVKASTLKRDIAYFLGYPIKTENLDFRVFPLEFIEKDEKVLRLFTRDLDYDYEKHREEFRKKSIDEIWVTYGIPFIFVITLGFLLTLIFGDLIVRLVFEFL
ncbi:MAG: A24 family peptidase C-terminal domain-containing protein, partial [Candidatus Methanofastidiosia archaeon]